MARTPSERCGWKQRPADGSHSGRWRNIPAWSGSAIPPMTAEGWERPLQPGRGRGLPITPRRVQLAADHDEGGALGHLLEADRADIGHHRAHPAHQFRNRAFDRAAIGHLDGLALEGAVCGDAAYRLFPLGPFTSGVFALFSRPSLRQRARRSGSITPLATAS